MLFASRLFSSQAEPRISFQTQRKYINAVFFFRQLKSKDAFSKSDAVCILFTKDPKDGTEIEIDRTEQLKNNPNPEWMKKFELEYRFEEKQVVNGLYLILCLFLPVLGDIRISGVLRRLS